MVSGGIGAFNTPQVGVEAVVKGVQAYMQDVSRVVDGQNKIQRATEETARVTKRSTAEIQQAWTRVGRTMVVAGAAITAGFGFATKAAIDFEQQFANVRKTVDLSEDEFARLERGIFDLSRILPVATSEINQVVSIAGQLGVEGVDNLINFAQVAIGMGISTDLSAQDAAFRLAQLLEVTKSAPEDLEPMASAIVELGNNTATTESRIADFALRLAPTAERIGLTTTELLGISATVLSLGINTERGATAIDLAFTQIEKSVAKGGESLQLIAATARMTREEFTLLFQQAPLDAFLAFIRGLDAAGSQASLVLDELTIGGVRAAGTLGALAQNADFLAENLGTANRGLQDNVALTEEVDRFSSTASAQLRIFRNRLGEVAIEIGRALVPAIETGVDVLTFFIELWEKLPAPLQNVLVIGGAIVGMLTLLGGALILGVGQLVISLTALSTILPTVAAGFTGATGAALGFTAALGPLGIAAAAIGAALALASLFGLFGGGGEDADKTAVKIRQLAEDFDDLTVAELVAADRAGQLGEGFERIDRSIRNVPRLSSEVVKGISAVVQAGGELRDVLLVVDALTRGVELGTGAESSLNKLAESLGLTRVETLKLISTLTGIDTALEQVAVSTTRARNDVEAYNEVTELLALRNEEAAESFDPFADAMDESAGKLDNLSGRAVAAIFAIELLAATVATTGPQFLDEIDRIFNEGVDAVEAAERAAIARAGVAEDIFQMALSRINIVKEQIGGAGGAQQILSGFDLAVEEIQRAKANEALLTFLQVASAFGADQPAVLAALLAAEAETSGDITAGLRKIVDLFPDLEDFLFTGRSQFEGPGLIALFDILGASLATRIPSFQTGGFVGGDRVGAPILAQLHVGEFVIPADRVAALLNPVLGRGSDPGTINFTANYFEVESPVRVRDDVERLRMMGRR